jgi:hypothetical protein
MWLFQESEKSLNDNERSYIVTRVTCVTWPMKILRRIKAGTPALVFFGDFDFDVEVTELAA